MKQIRRRLLWDGALLVLALASGISVFLARRCNSLVSRSDTATLLFPSLSGGPPHSLSVTREGMTVRVVNQSKDSDSPVWYAESPWNREGDLATVDSVITTLRDLQVVRRLSFGPQGALCRLGAHRAPRADSSSSHVGCVPSYQLLPRNGAFEPHLDAAAGRHGDQRLEDIECGPQTFDV